MNKSKKMIWGIFISILVLVLGIFGYIYTKLDSIYVKDEVKGSQSKKEERDGKMVEGITNILLVGIDGTNIDKGNRSDSVMLCTIDGINKKLKITSIARDTYVEIPNYGYEKLTHAYAYGGIDLLKEVFKINFDLEIDRYVAVNFVSFIDIIDEIGGVEVDVKEKDKNEVNKYIDACYEYYGNREDKDPKEYIYESGVQRLNGYQALAFSRIRYTDSAYARDNRHREIAQSVYNEFLKQDPMTYKRASDILLQNTKTNISPVEMMDLAYTVYNIKDKNIYQLEFPLKEHRTGRIVSQEKGWVIEWDKSENLNVLHEFIFGKNYEG
ncbi:LytR family transcriptional regulator [[Clostridium] sordellii]|uniref:LCP family protein n=1 Tax=Paraclostridium sordellii TaxID=1505 RepID=UPI0005424F9B|nr:LCP family protein [Paeniclostridium sordellii]CEK31596.1 LytR family transcriptional regulator [[Clostridium] sordellii] [Paeniclostridium sordellii]